MKRNFLIGLAGISLALCVALIGCDQDGGGGGSGKGSVLTGTVTIIGTAKVGQTLTTNTGNLGGSGTITYQWKKGDSAQTINIGIGIDANAYTPVVADEGKYLAVTVTRVGYTGSVTSLPTPAVLNENVAAPTVTGVTVFPATASVAQGATQLFSASVAGTNNPAQTVTWTIVEANKAAGTTIVNGLLTVAVNETLSALTVRATSTVDTGKSGEATVTVNIKNVNSGSKTLTFKLTPISVNNFTVTVSGGTWKSGTFMWKNDGTALSFDNAIDCSPGITYSYQDIIVTRTSDTVLTFTLLPKGIQDNSGTIRLGESEYGAWFLAMHCTGDYGSIDGYTITYINEDYNYVIASDSGTAAYYL
jgi:hypothetical protein